MKFRSPEGIMTDAWHLNDHDRIHYFHLKMDEQFKNLPSVGHLYTDDLLTFTKCDDILPVLPREQYPEDCLAKWTGCAITAQDGVHYIYYTMRNAFEAQKIGLCTSRDLKRFDLYEKNPVLTPDSSVFFYGDGKQYEDCRDMIVVYDGQSKKYYGYFAAMAEENGRKFGVIGVAESDDLLAWSNQAIAFKCDFDGTIEVPDVFYLDGKWYLTVLTHACFGARYVFSDRNVVSGSLYAVSDSPKGPFLLKEDNVFIGGTMSSGYTCRSFDYKGKKYLSYIDKSEYGWSISLPKEIRVVEGKLTPCYTPILERLRKREVITSPMIDRLAPQPGTVFWKLGSATLAQEGGVLTVNVKKGSFQSYMLDTERMQGVEVSYTFTLENGEGGIRIETTDPSGNSLMHLAVASVSESAFTLYADGLNFDVVSKRAYPFESGKKYHARILIYDGIVEVYVDDALLIQNKFLTQNARIGLFCGDGTCTFEDFCVYELE